MYNIVNDWESCSRSNYAPEHNFKLHVLGGEARFFTLFGGFEVGPSLFRAGSLHCRVLSISLANGTVPLY